MVKKIIIPKNENYILNIPKEFLNKKVEIILKLHDPKKNKKNLKEKIKRLFKEKKVKIFEEIKDPVEWQKKVRNEWN